MSGQNYLGVPAHLRREQAIRDSVQQEFRAEHASGDTPSIRREKVPPIDPALVPTDDELHLRLAEELEYARRMLDAMGDELSADMGVVMRHAVALQSVDIVGQMIGHIADSYGYYCGRAAKGRGVEWSDTIEKGKTDKATLAPRLKQAVDACNAVYGTGTGDIGQLMANVAHTNLHYGNLITYIRMLGMTPPSS